MRKIWLLASGLLMLGFPNIALAQTQSVVGTWRLVAVKSTSLKGEVNPTAFGAKPTGYATFTANGRMTLIMCDDGRKPLSVVDRVSAPVEERAEAFATFVAYAGRYSVEPGKVIFHIEAASIQNWVNTDLTRSTTFENDRLSLKTMTTVKGGVQQVIETVWERLH
jgi:Lipocalin-like domain